MTGPQLSSQEKDELSRLSAVDLVNNAMASGYVNAVREVLRKKGLHKSVEKAFQKMQKNFEYL